MGCNRVVRCSVFHARAGALSWLFVSIRTMFPNMCTYKSFKNALLYANPRHLSPSNDFNLDLKYHNVEVPLWGSAVKSVDPITFT